MALPITIDKAFARVKTREIVSAGETGPVISQTKVGIDVGLFDIGRFGGTVVVLSLDEVEKFLLELQGAVEELREGGG